MKRPDMRPRPAGRRRERAKRARVSTNQIMLEFSRIKRIKPILLVLLGAATLYPACSDDLPVSTGEQPSLKDQTCYDFANYLYTASLTVTPGAAGAVAVAGDLLYVADGNSGLQVIDVEDLTAPVLRGAVTTAQQALDVDVAGNAAYVAIGRAGLVVVDVGDPDAPEITGGVDTPGSVSGICVSETVAYVADDVVGLMLFDVSDPDSPSPLGVDNTTGRAVDVAVTSALAYVADEVIGLRVVNVNDPMTPWLVNAVPIPGTSSGVAVAGGYAYIADANSGLRIVDISSPGAEVIVGSLDTSIGAVDVAVDDGVAFLTLGVSGLLVLDVTNPEVPTAVNSVASSDRSVGLAAANGYAYVAEVNGGLRVVNAVNPDPVPVLARLEVTEGQTVALVDTDAKTVIGVEPGKELFGIQREGSLLLREGSAVVPDVVADLVVRNGFAYLAEGMDGLEVFDVSDPGSFSSLGHIPYDGNVIDLDVVGEVVYFATDGTYLGIYETGSETLTEFRIAYGITSAVGVNGNVAYVASRNRQMNMVDVSNPNLPVGLGLLPVIEGSGEDIIVGSGVIYIITSNKFGGATNGVAIYDTYIPQLPRPTSFLRLPGQPVEATLSGNVLYVALGNNGLVVIDVSDPLNPARVGEVSAMDATSGVAVTGGVAFIAGGADGLRAVPGQACPPSP
jgi:hypothetical protein